MSLYQTNINCIVAALYQKGLRHAVICPGSRNAPLIMAFSRFGKIRCFSVADERSAAFIALGIAKKSDNPVAIVCTSGSAVLNLYPAIAEAYYMQVPLLVITADRPAEMLDRWDGQTIHQLEVFKPHVLSSYKIPEDIDVDLKDVITGTVCNLYDHANGLLKGPVHLNVPLKEPLYAAANTEFFYPSVHIMDEVMTVKRPWEFLLEEEKFNMDIRKVLVLHGANTDCRRIESDNPGKHHFAVVISDCVSNKHPLANIRNWEGLLLNASESEQKELVPDLLITTGKMVLNKSIKNLFRKHKPGRHWHIDESGYCADTFFTDPVLMDLQPEEFFDKFTPFLPLVESEYFKVWKALSVKKADNSERIISEKYSAFSTIRELLGQLPENLVLHLANSMSVRYVAYLNEYLKDTWEIYSNRGVSGIDGCTSTAVGAAIADDRLHVLITGDIAFFYDINALWQQHFPANLKIVILNDFGGGIFKNIDGAGQLPELNPYLETPHRMDARLLAEHFKLNYYVVKNQDELSVNKPLWLMSKQGSIMEIQTDSEVNARVFNNYKQHQ